MRRLDRYLIVTVVGGALLALAVILALLLVFEYMDEIEDIGRGDYTALTALVFVLLRLPYRIYQGFSMATLIGSLMGLGALAANSELTAMRAAGVSVGRVARAVTVAGVLLGACALAIGEWLAPPAERWAQELRSIAIHERVTASDRGFWARDGNLFVEVQRAVTQQQLAGLRIFELDNNGRPMRVLTAPSARYVDDQWVLAQPVITVFTDSGIRVETPASWAWQSDLQPKLLDVVVVDPETLPISDLLSYIGYLQRNGLETDQYRLALWTKIAAPLATVAMLLLTVPLVFGGVRSAGAGQRIFLGVLIGLGFVLLNRLLTRAGIVYGLPPSLSALLPTLGVLLTGIVGILRMRR
ncbi:MAG TPA: LPS export ABC transporter permease LptG [Gammaproteobacteria bacterium]|nr:LPS export ABC transporter permease LptG [Gammaproteobacteria bacterium]